MGGLFGVIGKGEIIEDLFYGTDYHSHLGTKRGGLAAGDGGTIAANVPSRAAASPAWPSSRIGRISSPEPRSTMRSTSAASPPSTSAAMVTGSAELGQGGS